MRRSMAALDIGQHAGNGLLGLRDEARDKMVDHLKGVGAVTPAGSVRWERLLAIVMNG